MFIEDTDFVIIVFEIQNYINRTLYIDPKWPK